MTVNSICMEATCSESPDAEWCLHGLLSWEYESTPVQQLGLCLRVFWSSRLQHYLEYDLIPQGCESHVYTADGATPLPFMHNFVDLSITAEDFLHTALSGPFS